MKIIIIGAGELGRLLAKTLTAGKHNVVVVDSSAEELERLGDRLDVMRVEGSCASVSTLKKAGIESADALLAVSGDEAANILSCQIAAQFGIKQTICRLYRSDSISEKDGIGADHFGIWRTFSTPEASVKKISDVLDNRIVLERIQFSRAGACMAIVRVADSSPLVGIRLRDISCGSILDNVRLAAVLHGKQFLVPRGETILGAGDKIYIAGRGADVQTFIDWIAPEESVRGRVVISGAGGTGLMLAREAFEQHYDVRIIERSRTRAEAVLDELPSGVMLVQGDPTGEELLEEAGTGSAEVFASVAEDDEDNILSCIIAKRIGARKVIALTHKPEYIRIIPEMGMIDCGFSATLISANTVLRFLEGDLIRLDATLQNFHASLEEFKISKKSPLAGKPLNSCAGILPPGAVFALLFRENKVITPSGKTVLQPGDVAVAIVTDRTKRMLLRLFPQD